MVVSVRDRSYGLWLCSADYHIREYERQSFNDQPTLIFLIAKAAVAKKVVTKKVAKKSAPKRVKKTATKKAAKKGGKKAAKKAPAAKWFPE